MNENSTNNRIESEALLDYVNSKIAIYVADSGIYKYAYDNSEAFRKFVSNTSSEMNNYFNKLNHTIQMFITQNKETMDYFHRFNKIMINSEPWEVQGVDSISTPGILEVHLKETYNNTPETDIDAAVHAAIDVIEIDEKDETYIHGPNEVYPYEVHEYQLKNYIGEPGIWKLVNMSRKNMAKLTHADDMGVNVNILTGKSGDLELVYETARGAVIAALNIKIKSL